jgi:nucleoside-triphosphatase THEP1
MKISIVTGPVHSGKTTFLQKLIKERKNVAGILSPVINDFRYFQNCLNGEIKSMEITSEDPNVLQIGRFHFSQTAFDWASKILKTAINDHAEVVVIDEIGPLELQNKGFAKLLRDILTQDDFNGELIIVIREKILDEVLLFFKIKKENVNIIKWN